MLAAARILLTKKPIIRSISQPAYLASFTNLHIEMPTTQYGNIKKANVHKKPLTKNEKLKRTSVKIIKKAMPEEFEETVSMPERYKDGFQPEDLENANPLIKKALHLNNASITEILQFRINNAIKKFQKSPNDTGSSAVQVAAMSERIIWMTNHLTNNRSDKVSYRALQKLVDQRRIMLNYLRRTDYHYYKWVTTEYNIPAIEPLNSHHKTNFHLYRNKGCKIVKK